MAGLNRPRRASLLRKFTIEELKRELARRERERIRELKKAMRQHEEALEQLRRQLGKPAIAAQPSTARKRFTTVIPRRRRRGTIRAVADRIVRVIADKRGGFTIADLREAIRAKPLKIKLALRLLRQEGKIRKTGDRRTTRYFPA